MFSVSFSLPAKYLINSSFCDSINVLRRATYGDDTIKQPYTMLNKPPTNAPNNKLTNMYPNNYIYMNMYVIYHNITCTFDSTLNKSGQKLGRYM